MQRVLQAFKRTLFEKTNQTPSLYWDRFGEAFKIFRFMGYIPYEIGDGQNTIESSVQAWLWVMLSAFVQLVIIAISDYMICDDKNWNTYDKTLESLIRLMFTNNIVFILATWRDNGKIIKYVNSWDSFIKKLEKTSNKSVTCLSKRAYRLLLMLVAMSTMGGIFEDQFTLQEGLNVFLAFAYFLNVVTTAYLTLFWAINCLFIVQVTRCLKRDLYYLLKTKAKRSLLNKYHLLWLELRNIALSFPEAFKGSFGLQIFINIIGLIFSIYGLMTYTVYTKNIIRAVGFFVIATWNITTLMVICEFSNLVSQELGRKLLYNMLLFNASARNCDILHSEEMRSFFDTLERNPSEFVIYGCITINRSLIITIISSLVTYIMVLLQFDLNAK